MTATIRQNHWLIKVAALAALATAPSALAQSWQTVLSFQLASGQNAAAHAVAADNAGEVFVAGAGGDASGVAHGLVLQTDTAEAAWSLSDDINPSPVVYQATDISGLGFDSSGFLYSAGFVLPYCSHSSCPNASWEVRKRFWTGASWVWSTVDLFQYAAGQPSQAYALVGSSDGKVYVAGSGQDAKGNLHWLVQRSGDGGQSWALVDDVSGPSGAASAAFLPGVGVFVGGPEFLNSGQPWQIRRSATGNPGTWTTVDSPFVGGVRSLATDGQGNLYAAGTQFIQTSSRPRVTGYDLWLTRKSSDGGHSWSTIDSFSYAPGQQADAYALGTDSAGNIVVVGRAYDAQRTAHWIARAPDATGVWQTVDDFQLVPGQYAAALAVTTDAAGKLLVAGDAKDADGDHFLVRRF